MSQQFDEFSKSLAEESLPRRESLKRIGAVFAGAILGSVGLKKAVAGPNTDPCTAFCKCSNKKQKNACMAACRDCGSDPRWLCGNCSGGYVCTDLGNDVDHCGTCFNYCSDPGPYEDGACIDGRCQYWCVDGADNCDGVCTDLASDVYNCGTCGYVCDGLDLGPHVAVTCVSGTCQSKVCSPYTSYNFDRNNCGRCGNVCPQGSACSFGICGSICVNCGGY